MSDLKKIIFSGQPNNPAIDKNQGIWACFRRLFPKIKKGKVGFGIGIDGVKFDTEVECKDESPEKNNAEIEKIKNEAGKFAAEATRIQAQLDDAPISRAIKINEALRQIYSDSATPESVKLLQLSNLMEADPILASQVEKINSICEQLKHIHGTNIYINNTVSSKS
ncbi:MAG: hypothetical protein HGB15_01910 [Chlorobaculum sp.]|jgi:hypothetical protein|nr:hypothetical protein [Chlorobaculum sp.]